MKAHLVPTAEQGRLLREMGLDTVEGAFAYSAGEALTKPRLGRRQRIRLTLTGDDGSEVVWYLKRYGKESLLRRLRRWVLPGMGDSPARGELDNIRLVQSADVATMDPIAFGHETGLMGVRRSYLVVASVPGEALERCFEEYVRRADEAAMEQFNAALITLLRRLHKGGLAHRDLYASHIFLAVAPDGPELHLIDLARVFMPHVRKFRWWIKDLAQLKYSMPAGWVDAYWEQILSAYLGRTDDQTWWRWARAIDAKVESMRRRQRRRGRP